MSDGADFLVLLDEVIAESEAQESIHNARPWLVRRPIDAARWLRATAFAYRRVPPWRRLLWRWQRSTRGWADCDVWNLDEYLARVISGSVMALRDQAHGYPGYEGAGSMGEWRDVLTRISGPLSVDWRQSVEGESAVDEFERERSAQVAQRDALRLLAEWFPAMWD